MAGSSHQLHLLPQQNDLVIGKPAGGTLIATMTTPASLTS